MRKSILLLIEILAAAVLIGFDQFVKALTVAKLKGQDAFVLIKGVFELDYLENRGSAFGMFQNQKIFLLTVCAVFLAIIVLIMVKTPAEKKYYPFHICLAGILAGGIGNMIDRFRLEYVIDMFSFVLIHFPVFNVADCYIVISVAILMILFLFVYKDDDLSFLSFKKNEKNKD